MSVGLDRAQGARRGLASDREQMPAGDRGPEPAAGGRHVGEPLPAVGGGVVALERGRVLVGGQRAPAHRVEEVARPRPPPGAHAGWGCSRRCSIACRRTPRSCRPGGHRPGRRRPRSDRRPRRPPPPRAGGCREGSSTQLPPRRANTRSVISALGSDPFGIQPPITTSSSLYVTAISWCRRTGSSGADFQPLITGS